MTLKRRERRQMAWAFGVTMLLAALLGVYVSTHQDHGPLGPECVATADGMTVGITREQARNATTITVVGKKLGVPNHAVTIALATVMQESELRNLSYGDRDSVGLFQQRPSQGWGTVEQLTDPIYSSTAFYTRLTKVKNWQQLSVNDAAQTVQRSAFPEAYGQWEGKARLLARVLTGEVPAGFSCRVEAKTLRPSPPAMTTRLSAEAGAPGLAVEVTEARGWSLASWLIPRADEYGIGSISFKNVRWTAKSNKWSPDTKAKQTVVVNPR